MKNFGKLIYPSFIRRVVDPNELLKTAIAKVGYTEKVVIGMDVAASEFYAEKGKTYDLNFKEVLITYVGTNCESKFHFLIRPVIHTRTSGLTSRKRSNDDDDDFVYGDKGFRAIFERMIPGSKLHIFVINLWETLMNHEEQRRNKNSTS
ncbi:hypothetical protein LXL04_016457 [Taraxacum kok-saghyz]